MCSRCLKHEGPARTGPLRLARGWRGWLLARHVARQLAGRRLAFVELREQRPGGTFGKSDVPPVSPSFRRLYDGPLVLNNDITPEMAAEIVESGKADAVAFGRPFIANPDLPLRIKDGHPLATEDYKLWYTNGTEGYLDYPTWEQAQAAA